MSEYREQDAKMYIELAEKKLKICDKYAAEEPHIYRKLIVGKSTFSIRRLDESGKYVQCHWAVMEALYNKKRTEPDSDIGEIFQQALLDEFAETVSPMHLMHCVECLLYQLNSEEQKTAPFSVDKSLLVEALRANIRRNSDRYSEFGILNDLKNCDERLFSLCGMHMLEELRKDETKAADEGRAQAACKGTVKSGKTKKWRCASAVVACMGMIALLAAVVVRQPLWIWICVGTGIVCLLTTGMSIWKRTRARKVRKAERTARKKWADAMFAAAAVCGATAYALLITLKLLNGYARQIPNGLGTVLLVLIASAILAYGVYDILVRGKDKKKEPDAHKETVQPSRTQHSLSDTPRAKPVPPVRVNREAREADPLGYPIPFKRLMIYPNWTFKIQAQTVVLHRLQWQSGGKRHESEVLLNEAENVLYRVDHREDERDPKRSYASTIRAQLAFDVKPKHHLPLVEWILLLQTDPLREYAECVTVEDKIVRTWEDKYERILKHSEMREPVEYQTGWNCTHSDIGLNYRRQRTLFLERIWLDVPSRVPYAVSIEMELNPEDRSADHELVALMESMVFSDPNEADKLMVPFRSWLDVDALRKKEEVYAASVQANPTGIEAHILDDVQKQIALLEKAEK